MSFPGGVTDSRISARTPIVIGFLALAGIFIRICMHDVRLAHDNWIATDYHVNESPMLDQPQLNHLDGNRTYIAKEDWPKADALIDWIIAKNRSGYKMVNSVKRLQDTKASCTAKWSRGTVEPDKTT